MVNFVRGGGIVQSKQYGKKKRYETRNNLASERPANPNKVSLNFHLDMWLLFLKQGIEKWRHRLQKLESIGFPVSTEVERVYTEKK